MSLAPAAEVLPRLRELAGRKVLVVGDVVLDRYVLGRATRLSREAPVPVLVHEESFSLPGSAANPARNIRALQSQAVQVAAVGQDAAGEELTSLLADAGVDTDSVLRLPDRTTTVKQRFLDRGSLRYPQQLARVDWLDPDAMPARHLGRLAREIETRLPQVDAVLVSDYQGGTIAGPVLDACLAAGAAGSTPICVDAQTDLWRYRGVSLVKCNREEAAGALGRALVDESDFEAATDEILDRLEAEIVVITRGDRGVSVRDRRAGYVYLPAPNRSEVFDVVGAGDTVIAIMTLGLVAGWSAHLAATVAQLGAGVVIQRLGNATPSYEDLEEAAHRWL